ncbi:MAG: RDD family protein [Anaerolineaceae bacterium]
MNCPTCGQAQPAGAQFCNNCGASLAIQIPVKPASEPVYSPVESMPAEPVPDEPTSEAVYTTPVITPEYAGFWKRFLAVILDGIIVGAIGWLLSRVTGNFFGNEFLNNTFFPFVIAWLYYTLMESSEKQATLGKQAMQIKVTDMQGRRISFGRANGRYFSKWLSAAILMIGYMMAGWTEKKQALHDLIAGTLVVMR